MANLASMTRDELNAHVAAWIAVAGMISANAP